MHFRLPSTRSRDAQRAASTIQRAVPRISFLLLLLLVMCGGPRTTGGGSDGEPVNRRSAALTASTTTQQALTGRVTPPDVGSGALISAATTGAVDVGDDGAVNYRVPVWVPDGVNGLRPSLSIDYGSESGSGLLGPKWTVSGLSKIVRCKPTVAQDGATGPLALSGDVFCLGNDRLIRVSGTVNSTGEFRTETNPFQKIVATNADATGILSFQVYEANGKISYYGRGPSSRLVLTVNSTNHTYAFYVDKVIDRYGNSMLVSYRHDKAYPCCAETQELVPYDVSWGGTQDTFGQRSVKFIYEPLSSYNPEAYQRAVAGVQVVGGQYLSSLEVYGPDGLGQAPLLKKYNFTYVTPSITGERLLHTISECDGNNVCKQPTTVSWEPGSLAYTRTDLGITDVAMPSAPNVTLTSSSVSTVPYTLSIADVYRRLIAVDLNHDGRDDIVYRQFTPNGSYSGQGLTSCDMAWVARLATATGGFGDPIVLANAADEDPGCGGPYVGKSPFYPYTGDVLFSDVDLDGYPEMLSPKGHDSYTQVAHGQQNFPYPTPITQTYDYENVAYTGAKAIFGNAGSVDFSPYCAVAVSSPFVAVGAVNGDGLHRIVRASTTAGKFCILSPVLGQPSSFNALAEPSSGGSFVDLDGDGNDEFLRRGATHQLDWAASTTMNNWVPSLPSAIPATGATLNSDGMTYSAGKAASLNRWFLDLNGDGLLDVAFVNRGVPNVIVGMLNVGGSFPYGTSTILPSGFQPGQDWYDTFVNVRIADFNLDGRQDLIMVDKGTTSAGPTRSTVRVLLSNGSGGFIVQDTTIPIGDPTDGTQAAAPWMPRIMPGDHGYQTTATLDINGDGLPDLVQLEAGRLIAYIRQGNKPDLVTHLIEGSGRRIDVLSAPSTDSSVYTPDPTLCTAPNNPKGRLSCLAGGRWLPKKIMISGREAPHTTLSSTTSYKFTGGVSDRFGRGFLGFSRRDVYGPASRHTTFTYLPTHSSDWGGPIYNYPWAFKPQTVTVDVDTPQGPNTHHRDVRTFAYSSDTLANNSRFMVLPLGNTARSYDCPSDGAGGCAGTPRLLGGENETIRYDQLFSFNAMGRPSHRATTYLDGNGATIRTDTVDVGFTGFDLTNWLMPVSSVVTTSANVSPAETVTRTVKYTPDPSPNGSTGLLTGDPHVIDFEPTGDTTAHLSVTVDRDTRGRVKTLTQNAGYPLTSDCNATCTQGCTPSCQSSCANAGSNQASCTASCISSCAAPCTQTCATTPGITRPIRFAYEDADGVYATTVWNALNQPTRTWRHPGYGLVVETDDPNHLASVASYDTFGRPRSQTAASGATVSFTYSDTIAPASNGGVDITILPEGKTTRQIKTHYDPFGRLTARTTPVDATRTLSERAAFDAAGRMIQRTVETNNGTQPTSTANTYVYTYDDLNRLLSDCHTAADLNHHCSTLQYDGLTTTATDESGRSIRHFFDALGRPTLDRAAGTSDASYSYGAFGLLRHEGTSDGAGSTDLSYDVLGRLVGSIRAGVGFRGTKYNAFGEVVSTYKLTSSTSGAPTQTVTYVRDSLGRLTNMTSDTTPVNRTFYWDTNAAGQAVQNGIGKLIDVQDGESLVNLHFDYDMNGLLFKKSWQVYNAGATEAYSVQFAYDSQGRLQTLTYPTMLGWSNPLTLGYAYDPYNGGTATVTDLANPGTPLWAASARNDLGEITQETLQAGAGPTLTRESTYDYVDGLLNNQDLHGTNGVAEFSYTYQADGLAATVTASGLAGPWIASFDYDNLGRMKSWQPTYGGLTVNYGYDGDGNLTTRSWPSETVTYTSSASTRTITTARSGQATESEDYQVDAWGRVWRTSALGFGYNDADEVFNQYEFAAARYDWIDRDGFGNRVLTTYGSAGSLLTLDDWVDVHRSPTGNEERTRLRVDGRLVGELTRTSNSPTRSATFYLTDMVGSVVAEASPTGIVTGRARRDPYGNLVSDATAPYLPADPVGTDPDGTSRLGFADHAREANWGLVDMNARFYSPRIGRFTSPDSIITNLGDRRTYNAFAYAAGNPVKFNDPSGHGLDDEGGGISIMPILGPDPTTDPGAYLDGPPSGQGGGQGGGQPASQDLTNGSVPTISNTEGIGTGSGEPLGPSGGPPAGSPPTIGPGDGEPPGGGGGPPGGQGPTDSPGGGVQIDLSGAPMINMSLAAPVGGERVGAPGPTPSAYTPNVFDTSGLNAICNSSPCALPPMTPGDLPSITHYSSVGELPNVVFHAPTVAVVHVGYSGTVVAGPIGLTAGISAGITAHAGLEFGVNLGYAGGYAAGVDQSFGIDLGSADSWKSGFNVSPSYSANLGLGITSVAVGSSTSLGVPNVKNGAVQLGLDESALVGLYGTVGVSGSFRFDGH